MKQNVLHSVQTLRGVAALLVVVLHTFVHLEARDQISAVPVLVDVGRAGVDIFFVISGFIMILISGNSFGKRGAALNFLIKRAIRIVPTYWLYTLLMAALLFSLPHLFSDGKSFQPLHLATSLAFIPWPNSVGQLKPVLPVGWTLNYEMYFYLVFAALLFLRKEVFIPLLALVMLTGLLVGVWTANLHPAFSVVTSPMLIEFLMGCTIGIFARRRDVRISTPIAAMLALTGAVLLVLTGLVDTSHIPRPIRWGVPSALLVAGAVFLERAGALSTHSLLAKLGDSSYSLYLSHLFTINAVGKIWATAFGSMYELFVPVAITVSAVVGYAAYRLIENPVTVYLNACHARWVTRTSGIPVAATAQQEA